MFTPGSIYFIENYKYENGGTPSDKLLIIVCIDDENSLLLRALTTSKQKVPDTSLNHGCTNNQFFSFFMFEKDRVIGVDAAGANFAFDLNTFVFFRDNIEIIPYATILSYYPDEIKLLAELSASEMKRFIKCISGSKFMKKAHRYFLLKHKDA